MAATDVPDPNTAGTPASPRVSYLTGNYAPVTEEVTALDLAVDGTIPPELNGRYVRNGPNPIADVDPTTHHWFMGDGMVHGICLRDGSARWYRNRYVGSAHVSEVRGVPDIAGPNWDGNPLGPNTSVGGWAGTTWAIVEAGGCPVELDYELGTVGRNDFGGTLPGAFTAHPKYDPGTGELHAMTYAWANWLDHAQYVIVAPDGQVRRTVDIPLPGMTMLHDMSLTDRYVVIYDQPCTVDLDWAFSGRFPFRWDPGYGNRVGLMPRDGTADDIVWIDLPLGYAFHPMNAYDTPDGRVVIDLCNYDTVFDEDPLGPFGEPTLPRLERWTLDPAARRSDVSVIDERPNEFPRINRAHNSLPYRFGYTAAISSDPSAGWSTIKHDVTTGERRCFDHGAGRAAGEPVFVARENAAAEDDGWLLTYVHDLANGTAEFVVIDAQEFETRGYVARVPLPRRVPFGFHGNWISDLAVAPG